MPVFVHIVGPVSRKGMVSVGIVERVWVKPRVKSMVKPRVEILTVMVGPRNICLTWLLVESLFWPLLYFSFQVISRL